ncbi:hypothetical protein [Aureimonas sp. Leaf324]|uniref:hypothetical protein n=1 Tax=Aureimonas sp. Leaf324 TaxID=1736336 RepID=UPI000AA74F7F|nr:hypothetical protein [Aureimonas sp. Leaf324]
MWKAIRDALRMIGEALSRTTSAISHGFWATDAWLTDFWNRWSRAVSGTSYRPAPVTDVQDSVDAIIGRRPDPSPSPDDLAERGALVRSAAVRILCGDRDAGRDLPSDVRLWLLALAKPDLRTVLDATDEQIGRHASGKQCIRGSGNRPVPVPDVERDLMTIRKREEALSRGLTMQERKHLEDVLAVRATREVEETPEPAGDEPTDVMSPRPRS